MKRCLSILKISVLVLLLPMLIPQITNAQMSKVKTVWIILMENHNWTGNNAGAAFGAPDLKGSPLAPYINGTLLNTSAHAEQYFNPPGNHPSQPNYLWLEAGTNFGVLSDTQPGQPQNIHRSTPGKAFGECRYFMEGLRGAGFRQPRVRRLPA